MRYDPAQACQTSGNPLAALPPTPTGNGCLGLKVSRHRGGKICLFFDDLELFKKNHLVLLISKDNSSSWIRSTGKF
jgi:hypothetical protein